MPERLNAAMRRLEAARQRRRRGALGPPMDADIEQASSVSAADQPEVTAFVRSVAGDRAVQMLEAR